MNKEKPIIFSTKMVNAILEGKKTQTRRIIKPQPLSESFDKPMWYEPAVVNKDGELEPGKPVFGISCLDGDWGIKSPYYPWQTIYVRETWATLNNDYKQDEEGSIYIYRADHITGNDGPDLIKWKPSIHMPRKAARIFLKVTDVRVEKLREITEEDVKAEGITKSKTYYRGEPHAIKGTPKAYNKAKEAFKGIWDSINGKKYPWESNPWVWVIQFERLIKEVD